MTADYALQSAPSALEYAVFFNGLISILTASRMIPANPFGIEIGKKSGIKRQIFLIKPYCFQDYPFHVIILAFKNKFVYS